MSTKNRDQPRQNVTIRDMANELELSITTVSRALGGYSDVGAETRQRVVEMADRLGYRPNRNAQRLVMRRTHVFAWIQSDNDRNFVDPHFIEVLAGVLRGVRVGGYDVILSSDTPEHQIGVYDRYVRDNSVDGFLVNLPQQVDDARISFLLESGQPFIVHGRDRRSDAYCWVDIDNFGIFRALTQLMIENDHTRIAFINGDEQYAFAAERRRGVEAALDAVGLPRETVRVYNATHPMGEAGDQLTQRALDDGRPTALIYSSALMAVEGEVTLEKAGLPAGAGMAVATMDDMLHRIDLSRFDGRVTFARSSLRDAGMQLAADLIRACEQGGPPRGTLVPIHFDFADGIDGSRIQGVEGLA